MEEPLHELGASHAEGVLEVLMRAGAVAVEGDGKASNDESGHGRKLIPTLRAVEVSKRL